jgi:curved DNA-binding protein CbpA
LSSTDGYAGSPFNPFGGGAGGRRTYTHYEILGVPRDASKAQIKAAFRVLAKKFHPDVLPGLEGTKFQKIVEAYRVLSDPLKRKAYDRETLEVERRRAWPYST